MRTARTERNYQRYNEKKTGVSNMYKALRNPPRKPITFVLTEQGETTADPEKVDQKAREAWTNIYVGTG